MREPSCRFSIQSKKFFVAKAELDKYTNIDILFETERLVIECQSKLLEWNSGSHGKLRSEFNEHQSRRNELWLAKNHPSISIQDNSTRPPEYQKGIDNDGEESWGSGYPEISFGNFDNPYDTDRDIITKIDNNKYTDEEVKLLLQQVNKVVFELSGEEQANAKLKYIKDFTEVSLKLNQVKNLESKLPEYVKYLEENHEKHITFLKKEKQLDQLKKEIKDLTTSSKS